MALRTQTATRIARLYFIAVALIALLALISQGFLQAYLYNLSFDSREINLAGKMRMLSQRTVKQALLIRDGGDIEGYRQQLNATTQEFFEIFDGLANGSTTLRVQEPPSQQARDLFSAARPLLVRSIDAADQLMLAEPGSAAFDHNLALLIENDEPLLSAIARIPALYDDLAKRDIQRLEWIELGLLILTLIVLALELRFIFQPISTIAIDAIARVEADAIEANRLRRLASMGEMSGGIAHELNSPLAALSFAIQRLQRRIKRGKSLNDEDLATQLDKMSADALRMGEIVQSVRALAAGKLPEPRQRQDAHSLLQHAVDNFRQRYGRHQLTIDITPPADPVEVFAVGYQIDQVLINLIKNAGEAIEKMDSPWVRLAAEQTAVGTRITVTDSGSGIPTHIAERIFDPFYSTKDIGSGMGLGLALCQKLVELHDGQLHYELINGHTTFVVFLPLSEAGPAPATTGGAG